MKVSELIEKLKEMPADMPVEYSLNDGHGSTEEVQFVELELYEDTWRINDNYEREKVPPVVMLS
jgi:hypothetical protein